MIHATNTLYIKQHFHLCIMLEFLHTFYFFLQSFVQIWHLSQKEKAPLLLRLSAPLSLKTAHKSERERETVRDSEREKKKIEEERAGWRKSEGGAETQKRDRAKEIRAYKDVNHLQI